jgi:hypothetical protein
MLGYLNFYKESFINWRGMLYKYKNTLHQFWEKWARSSSHRWIQFSPTTPFSGQNSRILAGYRPAGRDLVGNGQNSWIQPGWTESGRSRPERPDPGRLAGLAGIWPFPDQTSRIPDYLAKD